MDEIREENKDMGKDEQAGGSKEKKPEKKKSRKKRLLVLLLLLLCLACAGGYFIWKNSQPKSKYENDLNALAGFLPGKTQEEIEAELNRIIDEGRFNASINGEMTLADGMLDVCIENVPANNYNMVVEVYLYPKESGENPELIYQSGIVRQGFYIEKAEAKTSVEPGSYEGLAVFHAIMPDETEEEIGQTALNVLITVK